MQTHTARLGFGALSVCLALFTTGSALAASGQVVGNVNRVLVTGDSTWGG